MRRRVMLAAAVLLATLGAACATPQEWETKTVTMREGHPEEIPAWWRAYRGTKHLNVIMDGDPSEDWEYFVTRCADWGGRELLATVVTEEGNVGEWTCEWVDF